MQEYRIRRGQAKKIDLGSLCEEHFGQSNPDGEWTKTSYGALSTIKVRFEGGTRLVVDTQQVPTPDPDTAMKTIRAWNAFLEAATGYNAKQRGKKAQAEAKKAEA